MDAMGDIQDDDESPIVIHYEQHMVEHDDPSRES